MPRLNIPRHAAFAVAGAALSCAYLYLFGVSQSSALPALFLLASPLFLSDFARAMEGQKRASELEQSLSNALFQMASFPAGAPLEALLQSVSSADSGELGRQFAMTLRQVRSGMPAGEALSGLAKRNHSPLLARTVALLQTWQSSGADVSAALRQAADNASVVWAVRREAAASLEMHKYTLLLASALLVPCVLGVLFSVTAPFAAKDLSALGVGAKAGLQPMRQTLFFAIQLYLGVLAALSSLFAAYSQGKPFKAALYAAFLVPCSLFVFAASSKLFG